MGSVRCARTSSRSPEWRPTFVVLPPPCIPVGLHEDVVFAASNSRVSRPVVCVSLKGLDASAASSSATNTANESATSSGGSSFSSSPSPAVSAATAVTTATDVISRRDYSHQPNSYWRARTVEFNLAHPIVETHCLTGEDVAENCTQPLFLGPCLMQRDHPGGMGQWRDENEGNSFTGSKFHWLADWDAGDGGSAGRIVRGGQGELVGSTNTAYAVGYCRFPNKNFFYLCQRSEIGDTGADVKSTNPGALRINPVPPLEVGVDGWFLFFTILIWVYFLLLFWSFFGVYLSRDATLLKNTDATLLKLVGMQMHRQNQQQQMMQQVMSQHLIMQHQSSQHFGTPAPGAAPMVVGMPVAAGS